jgi:hypothetical protein
MIRFRIPYPGPFMVRLQRLLRLQNHPSVYPDIYAYVVYILTFSIPIPDSGIGTIVLEHPSCHSRS